MSNLTKLIIAVGLALGAAVLNAMWLSAEKHPTTYVAASTDIGGEDTITDEMLMAVAVPGNFDTLRQSLVPYENRAILYGLTPPRTYKPGDMFFQRDLKAPIELAQFEVLGPFRLISVGQQFTKGDDNKDEAQIDSGGNTITIAVSANFDDRTRRLLQIIDPNLDPNRDKAKRIVAIQVVPKEELAKTAAPDGKNEVYQTVTLEGIANVPRVLLAGDLIRFVIPARDSL